MCYLYKNSICGLGVRTQSDGKIAAGEWHRGEFHGYGVHALPDGTVEGQWAKNQMHGYCEENRNGFSMRGRWVRGQQAYGVGARLIVGAYSGGVFRDGLRIAVIEPAAAGEGGR